MQCRDSVWNPTWKACRCSANSGLWEQWYLCLELTECQGSAELCSALLFPDLESRPLGSVGSLCPD